MKKIAPIVGGGGGARSEFYHVDPPLLLYVKQESILLGYVPPTWQLYMFWWPPLCISTSGVGTMGSHPTPYGHAHP